MKLGLSTAAYYGQYETEEAAAHIRRNFSVDCVEVFLQTPSEYNARFGEIVRGKLDGLPATSVHPLGTAYENLLFSRSARQLQDAMDLFNGVLDAAQAMGAGTYVYHGPHNAKGAPLAPDFARYRQGLERMSEAAQLRGVRVCWENVWWCLLTSPERVHAVRALNAQLGFVLDIKQAMQGGHDAKEFVPAMGERLANLHVLDYDDTGRLCLPGQGTYDFKGLFAQLRAVGYDGPVILEPYSTMHSCDEEIARALSFLRQAMTDAQKQAG